MSRKPPLTQVNIDQVGEAIRAVLRMVDADGVRTLAERQCLAEVMALRPLARDLDEFRLNAISMLDFNRLNPRRERRMLEIVREDEHEPLDAA